MAEVKDILVATDHEVEISERSTEIDVRTQAIEMRQIVADIKRTMKKKNLSYLSAPAIGYKRRIFCIDFKDNEIKTFINPVIAKATGLQLSRESSYYIPEKEYIRPRNNDIITMYERPMGQIETRQIVGLSAVVFQQMMDDIDGLLLSDVGLELDENWDKLTDDERDEILDMYLDSLDIKHKEISKEIEETPELKELSDGIKFMESVYKGETTLECSPA